MGPNGALAGKVSRAGYMHRIRTRTANNPPVMAAGLILLFPRPCQARSACQEPVLPNMSLDRLREVEYPRASNVEAALGEFCNEAKMPRLKPYSAAGVEAAAAA
jgi:hypothetical protein